MVHFTSLEGKYLETPFQGSRVSLRANRVFYHYWAGNKLEGNHLVEKVTRHMFD